MLPGPGALALVLVVAGQRGHQQAAGAVRAQTDIHLVQPSRAGDGAQQGHHLLRQSCRPAGGIQRAGAVRLRPGRRVVQEYQVQIRAHAKLLAPQAAVAEHGEAQTDDVAAAGPQIAPRQFQHRIHHRVGQPGQLAAGLLRLLAPVQHRQGNAEAQRLAGLVEHEQRLLQILVAQRRGAGAGELGALGQRALGARVQQLVQQQRMGGHALGQERAAADQVDQPLQRAGLLVQQGQVGAAAQNVMQQRQQPAHRLQRAVGRGAGLQQHRHHPVQACAGGIGQFAHAGRAGEVAQRGIHVAGIGEPGRGQRARFTALGQRPPVAGNVAVHRRLLAALGQQGVELIAYQHAV